MAVEPCGSARLPGCPAPLTRLCAVRQASYEAQQAGQGAFEQQYRSLLDEITRVYQSAKECHSKVWLLTVYTT
jgi:hypothetical protein